jgi:GntR family transcriptional regulator / MocR family aminotransferase
MSNQEQVNSCVLRPRARGTPLVCWLYEEFRTAILEGRLSPGSKLPSRRMLALKYHMSIGTVVKAFERLIRQGYLDTRVGAGTYVRGALPDVLFEHGAPQVPVTAALPHRALSSRGRVLATQPFPRLGSNRSQGALRLDRPALDAFPIETWSRLGACRLTRGARTLLAHGEPLGYLPLRRAIADHIGEKQGVRCTADQVVVTSGTQQSLDLVARLLLDPGDRVWMEDPGYAGVTSLLRAHGAEVIGVPVDAQGIDCDAGRQRWPLARLAYVTPACQFPLGIPMSNERRLKLLQWASDAGAWIFEDDYEGFLQVNGRPLGPLFGLDRTSSVIYSGSFNRLLFSSLRVGFLVLPPAFVDSAAAALSITQRYHPILEQAVLADFILQGHFEIHRQRMREVYATRREALIETARTELSGLMQFKDSDCGLHTIGWLDSDMNEDHVWRCAAARNIDSIALSSLTIDRQMPPGLVFGFAGADERAIQTAVKRLGRVLRLLAWPAKRWVRGPREIGAAKSRNALASR